MIGLVAKDFIVFKKICKPAYRLLGIILLLCACIFIPKAAIPYISLLLPLMGVAFLTELVKIEEKSDWKNYLPVLPETSCQGLFNQIHKKATKKVPGSTFMLLTLRQAGHLRPLNSSSQRYAYSGNWSI